MPAVMPAEVQTGPSTMKMRSSSTFTLGKRACSLRAAPQCVVARRPSSRPASASTKAPVQVEATRRDCCTASCRNAITPGVSAPGWALPPTMIVSNGASSSGRSSGPFSALS